MIKTVFVPLMLKSYPVTESSQSAQKNLTNAMDAALEELNTALDDGWRIIAQQYSDSGYDVGTVFFIRDDAQGFLDLTEKGLQALDEPVEPITGEDFRGWG